VQKRGLLITGSGKIKRKHAFKSHILTKKATKRKRNLTYFGRRSQIGREKREAHARHEVNQTSRFLNFILT
jgi:hypothetical protein